MKTKKVKSIKKIISTVLVSAVVATFVTTAVEAVKTYNIGTYRFNPHYNQREDPIDDIFQCFYEAPTYDHGARAGIHYRSVNGFPRGVYVVLRYIENGQTKSVHCSTVKGKDRWIESPWVTINKNNIYPYQIDFYSNCYFKDSGALAYKDAVKFVV